MVQAVDVEVAKKSLTAYLCANDELALYFCGSLVAKAPSQESRHLRLKCSYAGFHAVVVGHLAVCFFQDGEDAVTVGDPSGREQPPAIRYKDEGEWTMVVGQLVGDDRCVRVNGQVCSEDPLDDSLVGRFLSSLPLPHS